MTARRTNAVSVMVVLALAVVWLSACTASLPGITTPTVTVRSETGERASGQAVDAIVSGVAGVYNRAIQSSGSGPQSVSGILGGGLGPSATLPAACEGVVLRYFNAQGQQQSSYDGATTTRITGVGTCSTNYGPVTLDITADDAQASSSTVLLNGTAQGTYTGSVVRGTVSNVRMSKQFCGAPAGGTITATMDALTATIKFNGTLNAVGTYTWNGIGVSFTVPMQPCS